MDITRIMCVFFGRPEDWCYLPRSQHLKPKPVSLQFTLVSQRAAAMNLILDGKWKPEGGAAANDVQKLPVPAASKAGQKNSPIPWNCVNLHVCFCA